MAAEPDHAATVSRTAERGDTLHGRVTERLVLAELGLREFELTRRRQLFLEQQPFTFGIDFSGAQLGLERGYGRLCLTELSALDLGEQVTLFDDAALELVHLAHQSAQARANRGRVLRVEGDRTDHPDHRC